MKANRHRSVCLKKETSILKILRFPLAGLGLLLVSSSCPLQPRAGFSIWATGDSVKIFPREPISRENHHWSSSSATLTLRGAANEWVGSQLVLYSLEPLKGIRVRVGDLKGESGTISASNVSFFRQIYIPVSRSTPREGSTGPGEYPDPLIPFFNPYSGQDEEIALPLSLEGGRNLPIWVDLFIPPGTSPGLYRGEIEVYSGRERLAAADFKVEVWNFSLPSRRQLMVFFDLYPFRWSRGEGRPFTLSATTWEVLKHYEIMAQSHGFSLGHQGLMPAEIEADGPVDWSFYDLYLGQVLDGTLFADGAPPACWRLPFDEAWEPGEEVLRNYARQVVEHWEEKNWNLQNSFAYVFDERGPWNQQVKDYGEILREESDGRINYFYTAAPHPNLYGVVNWWAPRASEYSPGLARERQRLGERAVFYHAGEPAVGLMCLDAIGLAFRTWGWMAWKYQADGFFGWAANFWGESPYTDPVSFHLDNGNLYVFYPGNRLPDIGLPPIPGPVSSFRMKMVRRGIQDYEYFHLAALLGIDPDPVVSSVVRKGLDETGSYGIDPQAWSRDPEDWYRARDRLGGLIHDHFNRLDQKEAEYVTGQKDQDREDH